MKASQLRILLVEDDPSLGKSISEGLQRYGYSVTWEKIPDQALHKFSMTEYQVVILDCMLPKISGLQLAAQMRKTTSEPFEIIFTSGIFKDRKFIQNSIRDTSALAFLTKPFELSDLKGVLEERFADQVTVSAPPLYESLAKEEPSDSLPEVFSESLCIQGFELPWVYTSLCRSKFSGHLKAKPSDTESFEIVFHEGHIIDIKMRDTESYFGVLLVEKGFTTPEEVDQSLLSKENKPIGQKLIEAHSLSPHAVNIVLSEQMLIRLSKTIQDYSIELEVTKAATPASPVRIHKDQLSSVNYDWVTSKLSEDWLKRFYLPWGECNLKWREKSSFLSGLKKMPVLKKHSLLLQRIDENESLANLIDRCHEMEGDLLQAIHFAFLQNALFFTIPQSENHDFQRKIQRLKRTYADMKNKNHFEILGLGRKIYSPSQISQAYLDLAKIFHPDKLDPSAPPELQELTQKVFARIAQAHETLKDNASRLNYQKKLEHGDVNQAFESEALFNEAVNLIQQANFAAAHKNLVRLSEVNYNRGYTHLYLAWTKLKLLKDRSSEEFENIKSIIAKVPPEDRHSAIYFFVRGLYSHLRNRPDKAIALYRNAISLDPSMAAPKQELRQLVKDQHHMKKDMGSMDWGTAITRLFKKSG